MFKYTFGTLVLFLVISFQMNAQEILIGLENNPVLNKIKKTSRFKSTLAEPDTLELPFIDDFARTDVYPDQKLWSDKSVFINSKNAKNPNSVGIATLDAIDEDGWVYSNTKMIGDSLTSQHINLNYPVNKNIYLSFMYQPQGVLDAPEEEDSLILEFWAPDSAKWFTKNKYPGSVVREFKHEFIHITEEQYLKKGFRFRFKNKISPTINSNSPTITSNCDQWHLDYIYLDTTRTLNDSKGLDIAFTQPLNTILDEYSSVPWDHYEFAQDALLTEALLLSYKNNSGISTSVKRNIYFKEVSENHYSKSLTLGVENIAPGQTISEERSLNLDFTNIAQDSAIIEVKATLDTEEEDIYRWNDTVTSYHIFKDYYAYDDGSAEMGYGLQGQGTRNAKIAYKFKNYSEDSLREVDIYFNKIQNTTLKRYFYFKIYSPDDNGLPGSLIYEKEFRDTVKTDLGLNEFQTINLDTSGIYMDNGDFFIVIEQPSENMLNIGMDLNADLREKLYFNIEGDWQESEFSGALMIRPIFKSDLVKKLTTIPKIEEQKSFTLYPNPARDNINFKDLPLSNKQYFYNIYDLSGRLVKSGQISGNTVSISNLDIGIYIVELRDSEKILERKRLIKNK